MTQLSRAERRLDFCLSTGESPLAGLLREAREELALELSHLTPRPCGDWRHAFRYRGRVVVQHESLFWLRTHEAFHVELGSAANADGIERARWFTQEQVASCVDEVWPPGLADWLHGLPVV